MKIAILGSGRIGGGLARLFVHSGHTVLIANSRGPESLAAMVAALGPAASAHTVADAVVPAEVVVIAVPWNATRDLLAPDAVTGKILIDTTNRFRPSDSEPSSSEQLASWYPGAAVVKSLNTMRSDALEALADRPGEPPLAHFVAGDDEPAKRIVTELVTSIGFDVIDTGDLRTGGRLLQPGGPVFNILLTSEEARLRLALSPAVDGRN